MYNINIEKLNTEQEIKELEEAYIDKVGHSSSRTNNERKLLFNFTILQYRLYEYLFRRKLSKTYKDKMILLVCDGVTWHKSKSLEIPKNIEIIHIPPYTPEMNPTCALWV